MDESKTCTLCSETKPCSDFYRATGGGFASWCKACTKARLKAIREPHLTRAPKSYTDDEGRVCPRCQAFKPWSRFKRPIADGFDTYCRPCRRLVDREAKQRNAEQIKQWQAEFRARPVDLTEVRRCPRCTESKARSEFPANGKAGYCKPCRAAYARERNQLSRDRRREEKYGYTPEDFASLLAKQGGGCAICGTTKITSGRWVSANPRDLHVDHDHVTGKVRGLLCNQCNVAIGLMADDLDRLIKAAEYVKNPPALM